MHPPLSGLKNGLLDAQHSLEVHKLAPEMELWEANDEAGIRLGIPHPGALGSALYLYEKPGLKLFSEWRALLVAGDFERAEKFAAETGLADMKAASRRYQAHRPGRACSRIGARGSVRCQPARPAGGRLPTFTAAADRVPRRAHGPDPKRLCRVRVHQVLRNGALLCRCDWFRQGPPHGWSSCE
jgi:hypothetical protein